MTAKDNELKTQITALENALDEKAQGIKEWANGAFVTVTEWNEFKTQINTTIANLTSRIETLEGSVGKINTTLDDMKATDKTLNDNVTVLTGRVTALETELVKVNAKITYLQTGSATKEQLDTVKISLETEIAKLKSDIAALQAEDEELQGKITALQNSLTSEIDRVETWAKDTFLSITNWNTAKARIESDISALNNKVGTIETSVTAMNTIITTLQKKVDKNTQDIEALTIRVNCLEGKHVAEEIDETTYLWSDDFTTCVVKGICKHCGARHSLTANSTREGYVYKVSFIDGKYTHQIDLTDLTAMPQTMYENALKIVFSKGETDITLILPKSFNSFSCINDAMSKSTVKVNLKLNGAEIIKESAFSYCLTLQSVNLPDVMEIENRAFETCSELSSVSADKVQKIGKYAFYDCVNITELSFPEVTEIVEYAFYGCEKLRTISLPKLTKVSSNLFNSCENLEAISLPSVTELANQAFRNSSLKSITLGSQITEVGVNVFAAISKNCVITLAKGQKNFTKAADGSFTISDTDVVAGVNSEFCGYAFKEIKIAE